MKPDTRVLIVDDEPNNISLLKQLLGAYGYHMSIARSGRECMRLVRAKAPDMLLLDVQMPDKTGIEVLAELRPEYPDLPIIMITAHDSREIRSAAYTAGANDFVLKPIISQEITGKVRAAIELSWYRERCSGCVKKYGVM